MGGAHGDDDFLTLAADLARRGRGRVEPNPMVGAVIVRRGSLVASGFHAGYGRVHAEPAALARAGRLARGSTLYVTLEPCSTFGKTAPCVERILVSGVKRVVVGALDPTRRHRGRGVAILRAAGLEVSVTPHPDCARLARSFRRALASPRPFVTAKWAMTADGFIATATGDSRWVTSARARLEAHRERANSDGVLLGARTAILDDPRLTVRGLVGRTPVRIVLDGRARLPLEASLVRTAWRVPFLLLAGQGASRAKLDAFRSRGVRVVTLRARRGRIPMADALEALKRLGIWRLLVEGGADVLGQLVGHGLADRVMVFVAPRVLGGLGRSPLAGPGPARMSSALPLASTAVRRLGPDLVIEGLLPRRLSR